MEIDTVEPIRNQFFFVRFFLTMFTYIHMCPLKIVIFHDVELPEGIHDWILYIYTHDYTQIDSPNAN